MDELEPRAVIEEIVDAFNQRDLTVIDRLFAPEFQDHDPGRATLPPGRDGVRQMWSAFWSAFPDMQLMVEDMLAEGNLVAVRALAQGTHRAELMGIPPTGHTVSVPALDINRVEQGKLVERWGLVDMLGLLQQLGAIPAPTNAAN